MAKRARQSQSKEAKPDTQHVPTQEERAKQVEAGELQEESLEDQMRADSVSGAVIDLDPPLPPNRQPPKGAGFRPTDLERLIAEHVAKEGLSESEAARLDRFRFIREHGLPNPTRLYRVSGRRAAHGEGRIDMGPIEVEATDEADAILRAADQLGISHRERHRVNFSVVVLEE